MRHIDRQKARIRRGVLGFLLIGTLSAGLVSCASSEAEPAETQTEETTSETTETEPAQPEPTTDYDVNSLSAERSHMEGPLAALIYTDLDLGDGTTVSLTWTGDQADWDPLNNLIEEYGYTYAQETDEVQAMDASVSVSADFLSQCAGALYADFDGTLPEVPPAEEIVDVGIQSLSGDTYTFGLGDRGEDSKDFAFSAWSEDTNGNAQVAMNVINFDGTSEAVYQFTLVKTEAEGFFAYGVTSLTRTAPDAGAADAGAYILPDSDTQVYTEEELRGFSKADLRLARNEIYARHGLLFSDPDLQAYFDAKSWYTGTTSEADFSSDVFNQVETENIQLIQSLESEN